ncbi:STAS domain-containing protein [Actinoplanes sp. NEAU-A11]|uniref:STAS domain-containing protein n=1 Tax=Actinoplanes aureus TaxID=2792083 RepID=A0A931C8L2_9ACTN|nr:STAS domain-containing protein [Actinoplanes aureus]
MTAAARDGEDVVTVVEVAGFPVRVVTLGADLDRSLVGQVRPVLTGAGRDVVIDMSEVGVVDSAGLGLLVRAFRSAKRRGASLCLVAPSRFVITVLHTMRLDGLFPIYPDVGSALRSVTTRTVTCAGANIRR